jgi:signal peptidase I
VVIVVSGERMASDAVPGWTPSTPRRVGAIMLSVVVWPGLGQALLGRFRWAAFWLLLPIVSMALIPVVGPVAAIMVVLPRLFAGAQAAVMRGAERQPDGARVGIVLALLFFGMCTAVGGIRRDVVENLSVPTAAMYPTLEAGDMLVVDKTAYGWRLPFAGKVGASAVRVGDVVAYVDAKGKPAVGRVLALGPTTFAVDDGVPVVGGAALAQKVLEAPCTYASFAHGQWADVACTRVEERAGERAWTVVRGPASAGWDVAALTVPEGHAAILGDNRDGTVAQHAVVPLGTIHGQPSFVWFSTAGQRGARWGRMGQRIGR